MQWIFKTSSFGGFLRVIIYYNKLNLHEGTLTFTISITPDYVSYGNTLWKRIYIFQYFFTKTDETMQIIIRF